ncbi:DnaD domain protein [Sporolactobacillus sp. CPB3-1]|uniref:DnaD domain protein n=1 Tax=Sporolactobacillus mangiferae TaxID=2940498 RepID=A0ABT0M6W0_9BACL|nr:DnaD domain protein [Sporolactobacillus mangiferae]MCL1630597.1 DnaD domain protein [Sporolactobacillus mangiferae]
MLQSWKEVLPGDHYRVQIHGLLHSFDQRVITCLYQPLVGLEAVSMYFTFWQEASDSEAFFTHHHLMGAMNLPLDRILLSRKKLEAIGLLHTFKKKESAPGQFVYRLEPPLTPNQFFNDGCLNLFLYRQVGPREYKRLIQMFTESSMDTEGYDEISVCFDDVFQSLPSAESAEERLMEASSGDTSFRSEAPGVGFRNHFDFKKMLVYLSDAIVDEDALTEEVRLAIDKLSFVYQLEPFDMSRAVQAAALHTGTIDIETLRKEVRDFYLLEHGPDELPALYERTQPAKDRELDEKKPETEEEKLIAWYERNSPYQLLEALGGGSRPAAPDLRLVENLMFDTQLNPGVINVLIDYISQINDHNLNKSFVEKVAAQWARANIRTVRGAMVYAREEQKKRAQIQNRSQASQNKTRQKRKTAQNEHHEIIPEWMNKPEQAEPKSREDDEAVEQRVKWLEDYLKNI